MKLKINIGHLIVHTFLIIGAISMLLPFIWMISTSLKAPSEVLEFPPRLIPRKKYFHKTVDGKELQAQIVDELEDGKVRVKLIGRGVARSKELVVQKSSLMTRRFIWSNYLRAWNKVDFPRYFFNTILVSVTVMISVLITSCMSAYAFAKMEFAGRDKLFIGFLSMMMVPMPVYLVPSYIILSKLNWIDTYWALIVPWLAHVFSIFLLRQHFKTIPRDLYDAAKIDGCSDWIFLWKIVVPLSKSVLITAGLFSLIGSWNSFMWPLIVTNSPDLRVIQVGLSYFSQEQGTDHELLMAASTFCIMPILIVFFFAQKRIISSFARSGLKG